MCIKLNWTQHHVLGSLAHGKQYSVIESLLVFFFFSSSAIYFVPVGTRIRRKRITNKSIRIRIRIHIRTLVVIIKINNNTILSQFRYNCMCHHNRYFVARRGIAFFGLLLCVYFVSYCCLVGFPRIRILLLLVHCDFLVLVLRLVLVVARYLYRCHPYYRLLRRIFLLRCRHTVGFVILAIVLC